MEDNFIADTHYYTTMVHFYRGELGRVMVWRQRLDATSNWAVAGATALISVGLSRQDVSHIVFLFANLIVFLLLVIEGRRYRYFDAFRARVRVLEAHFLMPVLMRDVQLLAGDWRRILSEDLLIPSFKINRREAAGRRLKRNYIWIFLIVLAAWIVKIHLHVLDPGSTGGFFSIVGKNQPLPHLIFWLIIGVFYAVLAYLFAYANFRKDPVSEFKRQTSKRTEWSM